MTFIHPDFMLHNATAKRLFHEHAENMPIIDYHCHLSPKEVAEDHRFRSITELWLGGDHYKWRAMRVNGIDERYITGDASDWEKFQKWAETVPYAITNPLYHWTHLELARIFGIYKLLNPDTAREIYDACNEKLQQPEYSALGIIKRFGVEVICTTDDPLDNLHWHTLMREQHPDSVQMLPAWRPDKVVAVEKREVWNNYVDHLANVSGVEINSYEKLVEALQIRHDYFHEHGCRLADNGVSEFPWGESNERKQEILFLCLRKGEFLPKSETDRFKATLLLELARMNARRGWAQQYHVGPLRNTNSRLFNELGPDVGCDSMGDWNVAEPLANFLDTLDHEGMLAKTVLYNINPRDNAVFATMMGNFQDGSVPGKIQWGSGWWFLDQKKGIEDQLHMLSLQGLLSRFVGMLTDSRSFLSYPRHEYFRRILCNFIGDEIEKGELPVEEMPRIEQMIEDICYHNAKNYFGF